MTNAYLKRAWVLPSENFDPKHEVFKINEEIYTNGTFGKHLLSVQPNYYNKKMVPKAIVKKEYDAYIENAIIKYHENHLELENMEFAHILKEYRDGLLLFDLMENEVWNAAAKDTVGLQQFYDENKADYMWKNRVDAIVISATDMNDIELVKNYLNEGKSVDEIKTIVNSGKKHKIIITNGIMEEGHQALPTDFEFKEGLSKIYQHNDAYHLINVLQVYPEDNKTLIEAKGKVISDYQNHIETNWLKILNERYKVVVNKETLQKVKSLILN